MIDKSPLVFLDDMCEALVKIEHYTSGLTEQTFTQSDIVLDAVIRNFEILGEAANHIPDAIRAAHPEIPWPQVIGLRNLLIHEYFGADPTILWKIIVTDLPGLKDKIALLIRQIEEQPSKID